MRRERQSKQKLAADAERVAEGRLLEFRDAGSKLHSVNMTLADYASQNKEAQLERVTKALATATERQSKAEATLQACVPTPPGCLLATACIWLDTLTAASFQAETCHDNFDCEHHEVAEAREPDGSVPRYGNGN